MKHFSYLLAIIVASTLGTTKLAQARGHGAGYDKGTPQHRVEKRIDRRQARQWERINDGIDRGELSRKEARRLLKNQRQIARMERRFERDGYYSPRERRAMEQALDRAGQRIKLAKNDGYSPRYGRHHRGWRGDHHRHGYDPYAFEQYDETYVTGSSSSTTISAQADGFSVSWSTSEQE